MDEPHRDLRHTSAALGTQLDQLRDHLRHLDELTARLRDLEERLRAAERILRDERR